MYSNFHFFSFILLLLLFLSTKELPLLHFVGMKKGLHLQPSFAADYFAQAWFPTVQDVLQADWQDAWHSPQPPV
jgi:hypothetical protein